MRKAKRRGVTATPSLFINGHNIPAASASEAGLRSERIDAAIQGKNLSTPTATPDKMSRAHTYSLQHGRASRSHRDRPRHLSDRIAFSGAVIVCASPADCSQVLHSRYATFHGVPLAAFGAVSYFAAFSCATLAAFGYRRAHDILAFTIAVMFGTELWLLYLQAYVLHAFCEYCLISAALIFLLAGIIVATPRRA